MIKPRNTRLTAAGALAALAIGAVAVPAGALAASHPSKGKSVTVHQARTTTAPRHDSSPDKGASIDRLDR
jgi:hypothetical protein